METNSLGERTRFVVFHTGFPCNNPKSYHDLSVAWVSTIQDVGNFASFHGDRAFKSSVPTSVILINIDRCLWKLNVLQEPGLKFPCLALESVVGPSRPTTDEIQCHEISRKKPSGLAKVYYIPWHISKTDDGLINGDSQYISQKPSFLS